MLEKIGLLILIGSIVLIAALPSSVNLTPVNDCREGYEENPYQTEQEHAEWCSDRLHKAEEEVRLCSIAVGVVGLIGLALYLGNKD